MMEYLNIVDLPQPAYEDLLYQNVPPSHLQALENELQTIQKPILISN